MCVAMALVFTFSHQVRASGKMLYNVCITASSADDDYAALEEIHDMFSTHFAIEQNAVDRRLIVNRVRKLKMYRCWLQGKFRKPLVDSESQL